MEVDSASPPIDPNLEESTAPTAPPTSTIESSSSSSDPDPIIASYDVYTNPTLPAGRQLLIMQHPNQRTPSAEAYQHLSEVRVKPRNGMIEVDVPLSYHLSDYDRDKGLKWGTALSRSMAAKNGGTHGLAGGFGVGAPAMRGGAGGKRRDPGEVDLDMLDTRDWSEAVRQDRVLRTQTMGGNFPVEAENGCRWMVGIFQGKQLHLTPATAVINLRPQLHHIDATTEQERLTRPREGAGGGGGGGASSGAAAGPSAAGAGKDGATGPPAPAARAITMTIKSASGNEVSTETMTDRLRFAQQEPWSKLKYEDDTSNKAWDMFSQNLVYKGPGAAVPSAEEPKEKAKASEEGREKGKEKAGDDNDDSMDVDGEDKDKEEIKVQQFDYPEPPPQLKGKWESSDFLKAVSGMQEGEGAEADKLDDVVEVKKEETQRAVGATKPRASAVASSAAAKKTAAKGKSVAFEK